MGVLEGGAEVRSGSSVTVGFVIMPEGRNKDHVHLDARVRFGSASIPAHFCGIYSDCTARTRQGWLDQQQAEQSVHRHNTCVIGEAPCVI